MTLKGIFCILTTVSVVFISLIESSKLPQGRGDKTIQIPDPTCNPTSSCSCQTVTGKKLDLSPLANSNLTPKFSDYSDTGAPGPDRYKYSWNPCLPFNEGDACQSVAVCQTFPDTGIRTNLGGQDSVQFQTNASTDQVTLLYTGVGSGLVGCLQRLTRVKLICDLNEEAKFEVIGELQECVYYFSLTSKYACLTDVVKPTTTPVIPPTTKPVTAPTTTPGTVPPQPPATATSMPGPSPGPYNLKTVVNLLIAITGVAGLGVIVLLLILVALCTKRLNTSSNQPEKHGIANPNYNPPAYDQLKSDSKSSS